MNQDIDKEYREITEYLFNQLPVFQIQGPGAYKPGLDTTKALADLFGNPQDKIKFIHIAGTNGKGSVAHSLAAILSSAGFKTGLFTSPHLLDFRERIRIDGEPIPKEKAVAFVKRFKTSGFEKSPTFFELTTVMAMDWFAEEGVEIAVMECGLGGRLDSTNIITPELSVVTNISLDHTALLGSTPEEIAGEKAGIIKKGIPVVCGDLSESVTKVIEKKAKEVGAAVILSTGRDCPYKGFIAHDDYIEYDTKRFGKLKSSLTGDCQPVNAATVMKSIEALLSRGMNISRDAIAKGMGNVQKLTGLLGRWYKFSEAPEGYCDTGHNPGAWRWLGPRLEKYSPKLKMVIGFVGDKDVGSILSTMPKEARYYFTAPSVSRRLDPETLATKARSKGLSGNVYDTVAEAWEAARREALEDGSMVFVGGSSFVVANLLEIIVVNK